MGSALTMVPPKVVVYPISSEGYHSRSPESQELTAVTDDPLARLKAGLDEDEARAKEALLGFPLTPGVPEPNIPADHWYASYHEVTQGAPWVDRQAQRPKRIPVADCGAANVYPARHIARQDPGRTLRRVVAHRKILARYEQAMNGDLPEWQAGRELLVAAAAILRGVIADLAAVYGDDDA
jgi:Family of unknown function (DUF6221)